MPFISFIDNLLSSNPTSSASSSANSQSNVGLDNNNDEDENEMEMLALMLMIDLLEDEVQEEENNLQQSMSQQPTLPPAPLGLNAQGSGSNQSPIAVSSASSATSIGASTGNIASATGNASLAGLNLPSYLQPLVGDIESASESTGVPAQIIAGQIMQETQGAANRVTYNPVLTHQNANGQTVPNEDVGLMQTDDGNYLNINNIPATPANFAAADQALTNPATSILTGAELLARQYPRSGSWASALNEYNGVDPNYANDIQQAIDSIGGTFQIT